MSTAITRVELRYEQDVVYARFRARIIAEQLGFDKNDQTRISTAVSEIARNAYQYAGGGEIEFFIDTGLEPNVYAITVRDHGKGIPNLDEILEGRFVSQTGMGLGIIGSKRLMDHFHIDTLPGKGTTVFLGKNLPVTAPQVTPALLTHIADVLVKTAAQSPFEEIQLQNQDLIRALEELRQRQEELISVNRELEDTNRGVVALYAELDEKAVSLKKANELKTRFLSNMSHEFRTPLNSVLALSRLLLDRSDGELTEEQEKQVVFIRKATEDLSTLVNDLLDLAKIEAGKTVVVTKEFTVQEIFSTLRGLLRPLLVNESVRLTFDDPEGIPTLFTDEGKVSQILRNFLSNAIKFTERGEIRVSAHLSVDGRSVIFAVADTGIGIDKKDQERIFEEYTQVERAQKGRITGTGLGLPIAKRLAQMLGGSVGVESTIGTGSTFTAIIPINFTDRREPAMTEPAVTIDRTQYPVLVIDDDEMTQVIYQKYLKQSGFQAVPALTIKEAQHILTTVKPLAVVLDIMIPGEDSWKFLAGFKSAEATRQIPVVIISVVDDPERGFTLGAEDYVIKPVERTWLLDKLQALSRTRPVEKVLIIDDDEVARYIMKGLLAGTKFTLLDAPDGQTGLSIAKTEHPDVIFLDLMMPGMSGFEVLSEMKKNPDLATIPVIVVSAKSLDETERKTLNAQALSVISKESLSGESVINTLTLALNRAMADKNTGGVNRNA
ncbi:MAG: ATP-binding protein [Dehalococcoidia bacterium]|jgi:signal transduction histidine kinase/DNA-binding response OmpR family regulator